MAGQPSRHSAKQRELDLAQLPAPIREGVEELRAAMPRGGVRCVHWNDRYVGIVADVEVVTT